MKILISAGAIPAMLDSVKYIGNRFRGGLALKTAKGLLDRGFEDITVVKWRYNPIQVDPRFNVVNVDDVTGYYRYVVDKTNVFDAYILAAAVANLMPAPEGRFWGEGKFPSHNYIEGDRFDIKFCIAPRIIERIKGIMAGHPLDPTLKGISPRATLIGYKLFDGPEEELIRGAKTVLRRSKANIVFANSPKWAKVRKLAVMSDGSVIPCTFDQHTNMIAQILRAEWYRTEIVEVETPKLTAEEQKIVETHPRTKDGDLTFGTFAIRKGNGFVTTTRGHQGSGICYVERVDSANRIVYANEKATLNAPLLGFILDHLGPNSCNVILHDHKQWPGVEPAVPYAFPGTTDELRAYDGVRFNLNAGQIGFNIEHHGYVLWWGSAQAALDCFLLRYSP